MGVLLLVALQVAGVFSGAAASGSETSASSMEVDIAVSAPPGGSVVAHFIQPGGEQQTLAMRERDTGRYGAIIEVGRIDYVVVFEALGAGGAQSPPQRLTEMGLDRAILGALPIAPTAATDEPVSRETSQWGWLGLGLGALSLALLALWALPDRVRVVVDDDEESAATQGDEVEPLT